MSRSRGRHRPDGSGSAGSSCVHHSPLAWRTPLSNSRSPRCAGPPPPRRWWGCWRATTWFSGCGISPSTTPDGVADSGDVGHRSVGIGAAIAQRHLSGRSEPLGVGVDVAAFAVGDRAVDRVVDAACPHRHAGRERVELDPPTVEAALRVVAERAGKQPGAGEHLEAVADADQRPPGVDEFAKPIAESDHQVERQHASGAERIGVAEAAGDDGESSLVEEVGPTDQFIGQHDPRRGARQFEREFRVVVAVGAGSGDDECRDAAHASTSPWNAWTSASSGRGSTPAIRSVDSSLTVPMRVARLSITFRNAADASRLDLDDESAARLREQRSGEVVVGQRCRWWRRVGRRCTSRRAPPRGRPR